VNRIFVSAIALLAVFCAFSARAATPAVSITIDDTVIARLLQLIAAHDDSDSSIEAWIDLPGNAELLKVGAVDDHLTRSRLHDNVKSVIDGTATDATQPKYAFDRLLVSPPKDYQAMIDVLHGRAHDWLVRCANRDASFTPAGVTVNQTVYLHVGGDWDAINKDGAIFINVQFFHDYFAPSWSGLDLLIAHETFHAVQNRAYGNPEATDTPDDAFVTALSKIQREGMARYVEVETDPESYRPQTYGFYFRAVDDESIRLFPELIGELSDLAGACYPDLNMSAYSDQVSAGLNAGGTYYTVGEGMARAIDRYAGRGRLVETVRNGPLDFFDCYAGLARRHSDLPPIPANALGRIEQLRKQYPTGRLPGE
jgi:hypothetical protein